VFIRNPEIESQPLSMSSCSVHVVKVKLSLYRTRQVSRRLGFPGISDIRHLKVKRLSAPCTSHFTRKEDIRVFGVEPTPGP
jgi:hypothetical protein